MTRRDRGSATVEIAMALPALTAVVAIALWGIAAAAAQVAGVDAVRAGARAAARGEPEAQVRAEIERAAPAGSQLEFRQDPDRTHLDLTVTVKPPVHLGLPALTLHVQAEAATEPAGPGDSAPRPP
ncbi:MAG: TadE family type IV pilus minor pilin [Streptosporangiaceae bacterium]